MAIRSRYFSPAIHIIIWVALLLVPAIVFRNVKFETGLPPYFFLYSNLYHIGLFYLNAYYLYPSFLTRKRWWLYIIFIGIIIAGSYRAKLLLIYWINPSFTIGDANEGILFFPTIPFLVAGAFFRFILDRIQAEKQEKERKAERLASELKFLRSQISPHFLFNIMTNLVSLARQKSDILEPTLIRLSDLLRYMLYETNEERFPVGKEAEYLKNYVELQKLRFGDDVLVTMNVETDQPSCTIEPMLLIPFVENAFKHGIGLVEDPFIDINLQVNNGHLVFRVSNNYNKENLSKDKNSGIGLVNVKNRLDLLYGDNYSLSVKDNSGIYIVELKLDLVC